MMMTELDKHLDKLKEEQEKRREKSDKLRKQALAKLTYEELNALLENYRPK